MSDNIKVAIKVRPLIKREKDEDLPVQWEIEDNKIAQIDPETRKKAETEYSFDYIFDRGSTNENVFDATVKPVVEAAMQGFNGTIFAYGQTSSGKTYTMMGTNDEPGVILLAVHSIFDYIKKDQTREFVLSVSYLEIYNEKINDLLDTQRKDLKVREENGEIKVECKEEFTHSVEDVLRVMKKGDKNRRIGETNMNERSSRSHTIFKISIYSVLRTNRDGDARVAQLNLIDLAGSERARHTGATGERFNEGIHINLSLSTLGLVIKQLSENESKGKKDGHISYRDSKLTRILQPSLGGNSLTTIICAVTPAAGEETLCTLAFAQRAKGIKNKPKVNETGSDKALIKRFRKQIHKLEETLKNMSDQLKQKDEKLQDIELLKGRIELLKTKILSGAVDSDTERKSRSQLNRRRTWAGSGTSPLGSPNFDLQLPTIEECEGPTEDPEEKKQYIKRRKSVFQNVKRVVHDESFSTEWEDFELQLIKDEEEKMARWSSDSSDNRSPPNLITRRVRFEEGIPEASESAELQTTPEKDKSTNMPSPETPKTHLRHQITNLCVEYNQLRTYTTLEKQLRQEESAAAAPPPEPMLEFMQKSLLDTEQICKDINKKYAELQSEHNILKNQHKESLNECQNLRKTIESLTSANEQLPTIESERNFYKTKFTETTDKLKILEDETSSHAYAMELIIGKHKSREIELEKTLNSAWEELKISKDDHKKSIDPENKKQFEQLETLINELTKKLNLAEEKIEEITTENKELKEKQDLLNSEFSLKIENYQKLISENDSKLLESSEMEEKLKNNEGIIESLNKSIENYEKLISEKDSKLLERSEMEEKLKNNGGIIENLTKTIEELERNVNDKNSEISDLKKSIADGKVEGQLQENLQKAREEELLKNTQIIKSLEEQNEEQLQKIATITENYEQKLLEMSGELSSITETLTKQLQDLEAENSQLKLEKLDNNNEKNIVMIESLEKQLQEKSGELTSLTESFTAQIQEVQAENEALKLEITRKHQEISSPPVPEVPESSPVLETPPQLLENVPNQETSENSPEEDQNLLKTQIASLEKSLELSKSSENALQSENSKLRAELDGMRTKKPQLNLSKRRSNGTKTEKTILEDSSVFANASYFDTSSLDTSVAPTDSVFTNMTFNSTMSTSIIDPDQSLLQDSQLHDLQSKNPTELLSLVQNLYKEYRRVIKENEQKVKETDDIQNHVTGFKSAVENLQETVLLLTNENSELVMKLEHEKNQAEEMKRSFEEQMANILEEKKNLEMLSKSMNSSGINLMNFSVSGISGDDSDPLRGKIESLTAENTQLSSDLMEKIEELDSIKKNLESQIEKCKNLEKENEDLSNDLMEKIEEYESIIKSLKEINDINQQKLEELSKNCEKTEEMEQSCTKCAHLAELIQARRTLKQEVKSADKKLTDLQQDFEKKSANIEKLQTKVKEDLNISGVLNDTIFNGSICDVQDGIDTVAYVEDKVEKLHSELETLKTNYDSLTLLYNKKCSEIENLKDESDVTSDNKLDRISREVQKHRDELHKFKKSINNVSNALDKFRNDKSMVEAEMETLKDQNKSLIEQLRIEEEKFVLSSSTSDEVIKNLQDEINTLKDQIKDTTHENNRLTTEISSLKLSTSQKIEENDQKNDYDNSVKIEELEDAKSYLKKEILSLKASQQIEISAKVIDLIKLFISTIMTKEQEIIQSIQSSHKKEKVKLEEEKKQLKDAEKRSSLWAKELEADVERLQNDLAAEESKKSGLEDEISRLNNSLKELNHEKNLLEEKVRVMEADYVTLQSDLDKYSKRSFSEDSRSSISQEDHEKILHEELLNKNIEHSSKLHIIEEKHKLKVEELENSLECLKTKNLELRSTIEGLEANKNNYQSIIDLKVIELEKSANTIDRLETEVTKLNQDCENLRAINEKHEEKIEEVMKLLKTKCDKLSEIKNQLQSMTPEYERLKDESLENQSRLEKYKTEIEFLRDENQKQKMLLDEFKDSLENEKIKSVSLEKQLADALNRNTVVQGELDNMVSKYEELRAENERLVRKMRNSTSKLTAERDLEDLKDENSGLKKSLEGASNRILDLQSQKSQLTSEITELKSKISSLGSSSPSQKIEIESLQATIATLQSQLRDLQAENNKLKVENKDLDEEMEDMLNKIKEMEVENGNLERQVFDMQDQMEAQLQATNNQTSAEFDTLKSNFDKLKEELDCQSVKCDFLLKENSELKSKIKDYSAEMTTQSKSNNSSRSASPTPGISTRRKRRSDLFNQNRPQELAQEFVVAEERECNCETFRNTIRELEHQIVLKKGKITAMEMQIEGMCIPYKKKCQDYEEMLTLSRQNVAQLQREVKKLREEHSKVSNCEKCKHWKENRRDAECQCIPDAMTGFMAPKSGIVQDQVMMDKKMEKMEKEKNILKRLCIERRNEITALTKKVTELERQLQSCETLANSHLSTGNVREETKENVPSNIMGQSKSSSRSYRLNQ